MDAIAAAVPHARVDFSGVERAERGPAASVRPLVWAQHDEAR